MSSVCLHLQFQIYLTYLAQVYDAFLHCCIAYLKCGTRVWKEYIYYLSETEFWDFQVTVLTKNANTKWRLTGNLISSLCQSNILLVFKVKMTIECNAVLILAE